MRGWSVLLVALLSISVVESSKCKQKYYESRSGREGFVPRRGCRGVDTLIPEEYWTTVGYDGQLRDGRSIDDFLVFPLEENNGHRQRNSYVGYWITRSKYGDNRHYEAFGHVQVKPDGRVCGWFVGLNEEAVEVCGGFRILSRSRHNPSEPIPFEWVQGPSLRNRDTLGFHHHRIAKYVQNADEIFFGDAQIKKKTFQGIAPENERFVEVTSPSDFDSRVWLLKKKSLSLPPQEQRRPVNIVEPRRNQDVDIYSDPHSEAKIANMRQYPYYDQYGRPSGDSSNSVRPAYDAYGRRVPYERYLSESLVEGAGAEPIWPEDQENLIHNEEKDRNTNDDIQQSNSNQYQNIATSNEAPVSPGQPGYSDWLRRQYAERGQIPIGGDPGYEDFYRQYKPVQQNQANQIFTQRNEQEPNADYQISQTSGGASPRVVNYNTDFGGRRPGAPGYQRPKFYVNLQSGEAVPAPYNIGSGSNPAGSIGNGVQPGQQDDRSNGIGSGAQPGQQIGSGVQPERDGYSREVQPGQSDYRSNIGSGAQPGQLIGSGVQPERDSYNKEVQPGQPDYRSNIGSGAQPGQIIGSGVQPERDEYTREVQPGQPDYRSNVGSGAQPGQLIGSGIEPGQPGYDSQIGNGAQPSSNSRNIQPGHPYLRSNAHTVGNGVQPGQSIGSGSGNGIGDGVRLESDQNEYGQNGIGSGAYPASNIGSGAQPNYNSVPYNNLERNGLVANDPNYNIGSGAVDQRTLSDADERYRDYDVYGRPLISNNAGAVAPQNNGAHNFKLAKFRPKTIVRDSNGNFYEQRFENGKIYFYSDPHTGEEQKRIEIAELEPKISQELEGRRRQEANLRQLIENSKRAGESRPVQPISAAQKARRSSINYQDQFFF